MTEHARAERSGEPSERQQRTTPRPPSDNAPLRATCDVERLPAGRTSEVTSGAGVAGRALQHAFSPQYASRSRQLSSVQSLTRLTLWPQSARALGRSNTSAARPLAQSGAQQRPHMIGGQIAALVHIFPYNVSFKQLRTALQPPGKAPHPTCCRACCGGRRPPSRLRGALPGRGPPSGSGKTRRCHTAARPRANPPVRSLSGRVPLLEEGNGSVRFYPAVGGPR